MCTLISSIKRIISKHMKTTTSSPEAHRKSRGLTTGWACTDQQTIASSSEMDNLTKSIPPRTSITTTQSRPSTRVSRSMHTPVLRRWATITRRWARMSRIRYDHRSNRWFSLRTSSRWKARRTTRRGKTLRASTREARTAVCMLNSSRWEVEALLGKIEDYEIQIIPIYMPSLERLMDLHRQARITTRKLTVTHLLKSASLATGCRTLAARARCWASRTLRTRLTRTC